MNRKHFYQILLLSILFFFLGIIYLPIRVALFTELENMKVRIIGGWEETHHLKVRYRTISPTIINSLRIRDFSLSGDGNDSRNFSLSSSSISLFYRINLLSRGSAKIDLSRVIIKRGDIYLILPGSDSPSQPLDISALTAGLSEYLERYFPSGTVELRDVDVHLSRGDDRLVWTIDQLRFNKQEENIQITHRGSLILNDQLTTGISLHGSLSSRLDSTNILVELSRFHSPYVIFERLEFQVAYNAEQIRVSKVNDKFPVDIALQGEGDRWDLSFHAEDFTPSQIVMPGEKISRFGEFFDLTINGSLSGALWGKRGDYHIDYDSRLQLEGSGETIREKLGGESLLTLNLKGSDGILDSEEVSLNSPRGFISYKGNLEIEDRKASGTLLLDDLSLGEKKLHSRWRLESEGQPFSIASERLILGSEDLGQITLVGETDWEEKSLLANLLYRGDMAGGIAMDIFARMDRKLTLQLWYELNDFSLEKGLRNFLSIGPSMDQTIERLRLSRLDSQGYGEWKEGKPSLRIDSLNVHDPLYSCSIQGYGNGNKLILSRIDWESEDWKGFGSLQGTIGEISQFQSRFSLNGNDYDTDIDWDNTLGTIKISGSYGLEGDLRFQGGNALNLRLTSSGFPLEWKGTALTANLNLSGYFSQDRRALNLHNSSILFEDSSLVYPGELTVSGIFEGESLHLSRVEWSDDFSHYRGTGDFLLPLDDRALFNGWMTLLSDREENIKLVFYRDGGKYNGYGEWENFIIDRIRPLKQSGRLSARIQGRDFLGEPQLDGEIRGSLKDWGELTSLFSLNNEKLVLSDLQGQSGDLKFNSGLLSLNREKGDLLLSLGLNGRLANREWQTGFMFQGTSRDLLKPGSSDFSGTLKTEAFLYDGNVISPVLSFRVSRTGDDISLMGGDERILSSYYNMADGMLQLSSEKLLPFSLYCSGILKRDYMDLTLSNIQMDLTKINPFMPLDYASQTAIVEFIQGNCRGEISLTGTPSDPVLNGVFTIDPLQLDTSYSAKSKGVTRMAVDITDNTITIPYFEFTMGQTGTIGAKGEVLVESWKAEEFRFDFFLAGHNGGSVPIIYPIKGLALNGEAQGDVSFYGTGQQYFIDGDLLLDRLVMSLAQTPQKTEIPKNERINPWDLNVDLTFTTGKAVSMVIPNEDFHVVKATVDIDQKIRYRLDNIPWIFSLTGDLSIRSGDIAYFDKTFYLSEGQVAFNENQDSFDPLLNVSAESTITYKGESVTLMIDYAGSLFSDFDPQFSSVPSYSERDILSMLQPYQDQEGTNSAIALALGTYADKYTFSAPFEEGIKDALHVDMVTIETGFLKNIIEDQLNSSQGVYTNDSSQYNVARYLDGTFLNVGKYLGRDLFMAGGISVDYDESRTVMSGMGFQFNVKLEMETPFFNIGWTYLPDDLDSRNSSEGFISDTSITINFRL